MKQSLVLILTLLSLQGFSQKYQGSIGNYPIYLELEDSDSDPIYASYFYKSHLKNIQLEGRSTETGFIFWEKYATESKSNEVFELEKVGDDLVGQWKNKNKILSVKLSPCKVNFGSILESHITFLRDSVEKFGDKELVWFTEKYSKIPGFRLGNGFTKKQREFINPQLDTMQKYHAFTFLDCEDFYVDFEIGLITDEYFCFTKTSSVYCGGAHPGHSLETFNYNLQTLQQIRNLEEIYPNNKFLELLKIKYQDDEDYEMECDYFTDLKAYHWEYLEWVLTENGLMIIPIFPHAMTPCRRPFLVLYEEMKN